jgi:hypothetical protein
VSFQPLPPISRRETGLRNVEPIPRVRLLSPDEREEARHERERKREEKAKKSGAQVEHGHVDYHG